MDEKEFFGNMTPEEKKAELTQYLQEKGMWPYSAEDLPGADTPINWLIEGWIKEGGVFNLCGPSKAGKSILALQLAYAIQTGTSFFGLNTKQGNVLYLDYELQPNEIKKRDELCREYSGFGDETQRVKIISQCDSWSSEAPPNITTMLEELQLVLDNYYTEETKPKLIVIDCVYALFNGLDENKAEDVQPVIRKIKGFSSKNKIACMFLTHTTKNGVVKGMSLMDATCGSSIYGRIVDGTIVISPKTNEIGNCEFNVYAQGRMQQGEVLKLYRSSQTSHMFDLNVPAVERSMEEMKNLYPEICAFIGEGGKSRKGVLKRFINESSTTLKQKGFYITQRDHAECGEKRDTVYIVKPNPF